MAPLLALLLAASAPPAHAGVFRRAIKAADGTHLATFLYQPERPLTGAPLVVLLPDVGTNHVFFDVDGQGLARELTARGFPVVSLDWRGTGSSQMPARAATLSELVELDVPAVADVLGADRPLVLLGWGYSGALAYAAATGALQQRVVGVIALNGVVELDVPNAFVARLFADPGRAVDLSQRLAGPAPQRGTTLFQLLFTHGAALSPELDTELLSHGLTTLSAPQVEQLEAWMHAGTTTLAGKPYPAQLSEVQAPVLALDGLRDNWTHPEFAGAVRDRIPETHLTFRPVNRFEGFREDVGHVGLVLGATSRRELVPIIDAFLHERVMAHEAAP
jgi:pimeloyl-ACP methyl ester carboxylesterase